MKRTFKESQWSQPMKCAYCGHVSQDVGAFYRENVPESERAVRPRDFVICVECGQFSRVSDDGKFLRVLTWLEALDVATLPQFREPVLIWQRVKARRTAQN